MMRALLRPVLLLLAVFTVVLGLAYPVVVTGVAQLAFPQQASGSLLRVGGVCVGSSLVGQAFTRPEFFWGRPSATARVPYDGAASAASNLAPSNPALRAAIAARVSALRAADPGNTRPVPIDLVTASGSGLDPHISPEAAYYQVPRVARARGLPEETVRRLVRSRIENWAPGFFGERRVNVLLLNLALNGLENGREK